MKILHRSRRALPPLPQVAELINKLHTTPNDELHEVLSQIDSWKWPRSDLNAWIKVLNKFDAILEEAIQDYEVDKLQVNVFTPSTKKTVCEILRFERLLLENSTNRKTFSSYDRINSLLFTSDLDVLILALNLLLRPAQQYSAQPAVSRALSISTPRLQSLAKRSSNLREYNVSLLDLVTDSGKQAIDALPSEAREVQFSFYKKEGSDLAKDKQKDMEVDVPEAPQVPQTPVRRGSTAAGVGPSTTVTSGAVNIHIDSHALESKSTMDVLADTIEAYNVPDEEKFELMCRIRTAQVLLPGHESDREKLAIVRLLATAIFVHTHSETLTTSSLFLYEPDLTQHLAELLALDRGVPIAVQTAAVAALDAMARYRTRVQEVLSATNAGVNHGTLMALLRKTVADVAAPDSSIPHSFVDSLLSFVTFLSSHAAGGNMVVGAGLVPLLIQVIENRLPQRLAVVSKTMQLVDNVLYSFQNAFQLFCNNRGVDVLVERIEYEVDLNISEFGAQEKVQDIPKSYGQMPVVRAALLKHILRSMHRMMQSSGTSEGLRGLIDSSLPKSVKKIIEHRGLFGPSVLPIAINIMATFVHNEPTSLAIIQEAGLPEAFYKTLENGLEPVIEVIQAIPNAIGALCLNEAGQNQLAARPTIIPGLFSIFTSERHQRVLQDKENAVLIGTAVDELIRHHPALKPAVFEAIKATLSKIEILGNSYVIPDNIKSWYCLVPPSPPSTSSDGDVAMADADQPVTAPTETAVTGSSSPEISGGDEASGKSHENIVISYIDVLCRFLEGLFQHTTHCKDFITQSDGLERLGRLTSLPCLPYDFGNSVASDSFVQVLRTMSEASPNDTMVYFAKLVRSSLDDTKDIWATLSPKSRFLDLINVTLETEEAANGTFRKLVTLHIRVTLLSDIYSTAGYAHGRFAISLLQVLMGRNAPEIIPDLGLLHRACVWENVLLKNSLPKDLDAIASQTVSPLLQSPSRDSVALPEAETTAAATNGAQAEASTTPDAMPAEETHPATEQGSAADNSRAMRHIAHQIPSALSPFFQAMVKLFSTRRNPDAVQKQQIMDASKVVATVMHRHLAPIDITDDKLSIISYYTFMLGLITMLSVEERTSQTTMHTVLIHAFYRQGGIQAVIDVCQLFISTIEEISATKAEDRSETASQELAHAFGGLKVALHLLLPLVSSKPIFESSQTALLLTKDKKDTDPDYFESHNFLVKLRLAVFPMVQQLWEASWLSTAPHGLMRSVVQIVLEILNGEGEEGTTGAAEGPAGGPASVVVGAPSLFRTTVPDENRIRQLTDMGFARPAAERALARTHNNVHAAAELLVSNPFRFQTETGTPAPADPEPAVEAEPEEAADNSMDEDTPPPPPAAEEQAEGAQAEGAPIDQPVAGPSESSEANEPPVEVKSTEEWRKELNALREPVKAGIGRVALRLVDEHPSLIFDIHNAFVGRPDGYQQASIRLLLDDIKQFSPSAYDVHEQHLAVRFRLLALVLNEAPSSFTSVQNGEKPFMDVILALLLAHPLRVEAEHPSIPKWMAAALLVSEALLSLSEEPRSITLPKEGEPIPKEELFTGPAYSEARPILFDFSLRLLALPNLPRDELLASLRLLVLLTRNHDLALDLAKRDGVALLFQSLKASSAGLAGAQSYITIILRHIVEDPTIVKAIMRQEIRRFLSHPRTRVADVAGFVRNCNSAAMRDPKAFIDVTASLCQLDRPYSSSYHITLKEEYASGKSGATASAEKAASNAPKDSSEPAPMQVDTPVHASDYLESVVHFLIGELMRAVKQPTDRASDAGQQSSGNIAEGPATQDATTSSAGAKDATGQDSTGQPDSDGVDYYYCGFLMQCLTELLFSYDCCKIAFLSYSPKKRPQGNAKETKYRTAALHFLLTDIITFGTISPEHPGETRKKVMLCNWAMSIIVALCVDSSAVPESKAVSQELVSVRKFVLEAVSRAIKDPVASESTDARYGRLLALCELCSRLLTVRFNNGSRKPAEETPTHIAKIMLEKNFVATLTNALADVDLNFPNVRGLVAAILKPLELLSKIAIKMSRASDKHKGAETQGEIEEVSLSEEEEEEEEEEEVSNQEDTLDLYRNSSLGMYGGQMEDHFDHEEDMDEDQGDEDEDVDMDFGEETGSEDTSNTEGEDEEEDLDHPSGESDEEVWQDEEEDDEEDLVENEEGPVGEVDEEGEEDEGEDDEAVWEDIEVAGNNLPHIAPEDQEDDDLTGAVPIYHEGDDEEGEMASDEELGHELGILDVHEGAGGARDVFGFGNAVADGFPDFLDAQSMFLGGPRSHRHRGEDDDMEIFGRSRNAPAPAPETVTHPLLLEAANGAGRASAGQGRGGRRPHRSIFTGNSQQDLMQAIEDIIGGGAVQFFQHIIRRTGGQPETIRLDVPPGALVSLDRGGHFPRRGGGISASLRIERAPRAGDGRPEGRDFEPLVTAQRWAEEVKILHGKFGPDRASKLANHIILALLPDAVEKDKAAKAAEEKELAARREAEARAEAAAAKEAEEREAAAREQREAEAAAAATAAATHGPADDDTEMLDVSEEHEATPSGDQPSSGPGDVEITPTEGQAGQPEAGPSGATQRITVMIHGSEVDITDTGIDPTFLEALPDDMREEVLNQHVRDQRAARVERPDDSQISAEFLDALPPELRAEIIQQERLEQARRRAEESTTEAQQGAAAAAAAAAAAVDIDPASFIASLDPELRQDVLMDQDDGFIQTLPSHMIAEAGMYRDGGSRRIPVRHLGSRSDARTTAPAATAKKVPPPRDAIQLLDKGGIAVLVRLLFFPQISKKNTLFKVLLNLCENSRTRTELFNLLLNILQEGAADLAAVDRSFAQMTFRNSKGQTPRAVGKQRAGLDYLNMLPVPHLPSEVVPDLIAQRCLEALTFIVTSNEQSSLFFLTEHELPVGMRRTTSKKGKGKEKQAPQTQYPIVLLLSLLDRQSLLKTPSILESVVSLLDTVTRPLTGLKDAQKRAAEAAAKPPSSTTEAAGQPADTTVSPATEPPAPTTPTAQPIQPAQPAQSGTDSQPPAAPAKDTAAAAAGETMEEKILLANPPQIPHAVLRLIVNILTVGECGAKPFHHSLSLIQHLSYIPDAREVIAQELRLKAQEFGQSLQRDLDDLVNALQGSDSDVLASSVASKFSSPSSDQAKLLRVLKTIDYMYSAKAGTTPEGHNAEDSEKIQSIYESFQFTPLWRRLGDCLSIIEQRREIEHIATVLLPLIESLMVVCKYVGSTTTGSANHARMLRASSSPKSPTSARESMEDLFVSFTDDHRKVLNVMVRNNPSLMSGSFSLLVNNPRVLDFDNKRNYFNQQLHRRPHTREHYGTLQLNVRRQRVFEDSFQYLQRKTGDQIKYGKLSVRFYDEEGVDAGGVTREWFQILARQMFDPNNALFQPCAADRLTYQPNKASWVNPEHLSFFKFVGRVIGKAIYDGRLLDAYFARSMYRQMLGKPVDYRDVEWVDPEYYKSLCWILENDPSILDLTFSVEGDEFGVTKIVPLKENGDKIPVTLENRREFVQLSAQYRLYSSIKDQLEHLLAGFYEIIPKDLVSIFNEQELELLISGTPDIDVDEWRAATEYNGYTSSDPVIVWWWRALKSFNRDERAKVLSFATGTSRVPLSGFTDLQGVQGTQRFSIHRAYGDPDRLPQAHTCFNQIDLPQYSSYEKLRQQLLVAINEGGEGFGFA